ncbi:hypothetical protein KJ877_10110 [bacterium]|nr:hypothetical protein [bacterium]MBU1991156.1 hypothetical protein [bacterium]
MNISHLSALAKLISTNPNEAKTLIKLGSVDVLKSLGDGKYTVLLENKTLTAQSQMRLNEGARYWAQLTQDKNTLPQLSNLIKMPQLLKSFANENLAYTLKDLQTLLHSKNPAASLKQTLFEQLSNAMTKDEFSNTSNLLLSLQNQTFTIPLYYHNYFSILQFKKRYNKKLKKTQIDFYAALEFLGPVSGVITFEENDILIDLSVAYEKTKQILEDDMKNFSYTVTLSLAQNIEPLYEANLNSLLDVSI